MPPTARRRRRARVRASTHLALTLLDGLSASFSSRTAAPLRHTAWGPGQGVLATPGWHWGDRAEWEPGMQPTGAAGLFQVHVVRRPQRAVRRVCTDAPLMLSLTCRRQTFRHRRRYVGPS
jgi:hypothetical protein